MTEICKYCGKQIELVPFGKHDKWVTGKKDWHCGSDPAFPVRGHSPLVHYIFGSERIIATYLYDPATLARMTKIIDEYYEDYDVEPTGLAQAVVDELVSDFAIQEFPKEDGLPPVREEK